MLSKVLRIGLLILFAGLIVAIAVPGCKQEPEPATTETTQEAEEVMETKEAVDTTEEVAPEEVVPEDATETIEQTEKELTE